MRSNTLKSVFLVLGVAKAATMLDEFHEVSFITSNNFVHSNKHKSARRDKIQMSLRFLIMHKSN